MCCAKLIGSSVARIAPLSMLSTGETTGHARWLLGLPLDRQGFALLTREGLVELPELMSSLVKTLL
jgi:hypothetical protein